MWRIIKFIITGYWHEHKWIDIDTTKVTDLASGDRFKRFYCKCEICGIHKVFDVD